VAAPRRALDPVPSEKLLCWRWAKPGKCLAIDWSRGACRHRASASLAVPAPTHADGEPDLGVHVVGLFAFRKSPKGACTAPLGPQVAPSHMGMMGARRSYPTISSLQSGSALCGTCPAATIQTKAPREDAVTSPALRPHWAATAHFDGLAWLMAKRWCSLPQFAWGRRRSGPSLLHAPAVKPFMGTSAAQPTFRAWIPVWSSFTGDQRSQPNRARRLATSPVRTGKK